MKALVLRKHGRLDQLQVVSDYPVPQVIEGHVVIRVRASSFNYHDVFTVKGMPGIKVPLPVIRPRHGRRDRRGRPRRRQMEGRRPRAGQSAEQEKGLMGEMLDGGMAEYCLVAADQLVAMPQA